MPDYERLLKKVDEAIDRHAGDAVTLSDDLAKNPEISEQEFETARKHAQFLRKAGFEVETYLAVTHFFAPLITISARPFLTVPVTWSSPPRGISPL